MNFDISQVWNDEKEGFRLLLDAYGDEHKSDGIIIKLHKDSHMLRVEYDGKYLSLYGDKEVHYYRGLSLFLQSAAKADLNMALKIEEDIRFQDNGIMLDCSRNGVIQKEMMERVIRCCAGCGINQLLLYMEEVYEIQGNPYFGSMRGKYSYEELKALDEYGRKLGVELIPCIQTLAHLHTYLRWPVTKSLQDTEDILLAGSRETELLIRKMITNASRPFKSKQIHVGMDEAEYLGLGSYLRKNGYQNRHEIMNNHLSMVLNICDELNLKPMMWSDMFFRLKSATGDYYDLPADTKFQLNTPLPGHLNLVYWDYYHHKQLEYEKNLKLHKQLSQNISFAGGGWTWNGVSPNYRKAGKTLTEGMNASRDKGITKVMCTFWFDNGMETPLTTAWYSILLFAQLCYHEEAHGQNINEWLKQMTGYPIEAYKLLDELDSPKGGMEDNKNADNPSKYLLYQDVLLGVFDGQIRGLNLSAHYQAVKERLEGILCEINQNNLWKETFVYYKILAYLLELKAELGLALREAYQNRDRAGMLKAAQRLETCIPIMKELKERREKIWFSECKACGYEVLDIKLGGVVTRLQSAKRRVEAYLNGSVSRLEELEEELVVYQEDLENPEHKLCACSFWQNIVSAGNIAGI